MLKITDLNVVADFLLIEGVNLTLEKGKIYGLAAANGTGKSTFIRNVLGLLPANSGNVTLYSDGVRLSTGKAKKQLFYYETSNWFDKNLSGFDYLELINRQWSGKPSLIQEVIDYWQLDRFIHQPIKNYSLGMKQKVLLALYYVSDCDYWFLDEPTLGLDNQSVEDFKRYLEIARNQGRAIFFSAHESDRFFEICDTVYSINCQKMVERTEGTV